MARWARRDARGPPCMVEFTKGRPSVDDWIGRLMGRDDDCDETEVCSEILRMMGARNSDDGAGGLFSFVDLAAMSSDDLASPSSGSSGRSNRTLLHKRGDLRMLFTLSGRKFVECTRRSNGSGGRLSCGGRFAATHGSCDA